MHKNTWVKNDCFWFGTPAQRTALFRGNKGNFKLNLMSFSCLHAAGQHYCMSLPATLLHAVLFLTFLRIKYSWKKFPTWNIHRKCCRSSFSSRKLLSAFWSYCTLLYVLPQQLEQLLMNIAYVETNKLFDLFYYFWLSLSGISMILL